MESGTVPTVFTVALLLAALGLKTTDLCKAIVNLFRSKTRTAAINDIVTLVLTAVVGILVVQFLVKPSAWGDEVKIGDETLKDLPFGSTVVFGLVFTALASTLYDFKKAVAGGKGDNSDGANAGDSEELKFVV